MPFCISAVCEGYFSILECKSVQENVTLEAYFNKIHSETLIFQYFAVCSVPSIDLCHRINLFQGNKAENP